MKQKKCMKLKTRIVVAFLAIIIIPFLLTAVVLCWFANSKIRALGEEYGIKEPTYESLYNSSLAISKRMDAQFAKLQTMAEENPDQLEDNSCLNRLNAELTEDDFALRSERRTASITTGPPCLPMSSSCRLCRRTGRAPPCPAAVLTLRQKPRCW